MTRRRFLILAAWILAAGVNAPALLPSLKATVQALPSSFDDEEFWQLVQRFSERPGSFPSDNLLSNERAYQDVIPDLMHAATPNGAYVGVGPEQNFTYIAALKPKMAFIIDIRRGNLDLHLMYKALFDLSKDRAEFVSRLFSKEKPDGIGPRSTPREMFRALAQIEAREEVYDRNLHAILDDLITTHRFPLSSNDRKGIEYVYNAFYKYGPDITYSSTLAGFPGRSTYAQLMATSDGSGHSRSYLANEENFSILKDLQTRNLIILVVGNFSGDKAIRAVAGYLKESHATVSAFYLSNVEQYLSQDGIWNNFCANAATLPMDETSTFIRSVRRGRFGQGTGLNSVLGNMAEDLKDCAHD